MSERDEPPVIYWVDEDVHFVDKGLFYFGRERYVVRHFASATAAFAELSVAAVVKRGVIVIDVMLAPGDDDKLFCARNGFEEEQMGLLLYQELATRWLSPQSFPVVIYTGRADGRFKNQVLHFCNKHSLTPPLFKSTDMSSLMFCQEVIERFKAFPWAN